MRDRDRKPRRGRQGERDARLDRDRMTRRRIDQERPRLGGTKRLGETRK